MTTFLLTREERCDALWRRLREHYETRLAELRTKNDDQMSEAERNELLGRIAEVKRALAFDRDAPIVEPPPGEDG
jgi:hypothetical protein